jgi:hypothetical protein
LAAIDWDGNGGDREPGDTEKNSTNVCHCEMPPFLNSGKAESKAISSDENDNFMLRKVTNLSGSKNEHQGKKDPRREKVAKRPLLSAQGALRRG